MKKLPVAVICPETCYEGTGDNTRLYFEKGKTYRIVDQSNAHVSIYQPDIERGVFCLWKDCAFLSAGLVWIPVYSLDEEQLEFQFE